MSCHPIWNDMAKLHNILRITLGRPGKNDDKSRTFPIWGIARRWVRGGVQISGTTSMDLETAHGMVALAHIVFDDRADVMDDNDHLVRCVWPRKPWCLQSRSTRWPRCRRWWQSQCRVSERRTSAPRVGCSM